MAAKSNIWFILHQQQNCNWNCKVSWPFWKWLFYILILILIASGFFFLSCLFFAKNTMCYFNWEAHIIAIVGGFMQIRQNNVYVLVSRFKAFSWQVPFFKNTSLSILEKSKHKCYTDIWFSYQSHLPPNLILNEVYDSCIKS